ncbi:MAG: hypothetical protein O3C21_03130 [Verrucomicrobia bacterium]|nr:hypothetical protein [Verrucomicrobiota bacterium]
MREAPRASPRYENHGDHAEAVEVRYDPTKVSEFVEEEMEQYKCAVHRFLRVIPGADRAVEAHS